MFIQGYHIGIATFPGVMLINKGIQKFKNRKGNKISENLIVDFTPMKITEKAGMVAVA